MKRIRPLAVSLPLATVFIAWVWFSTAGIDYSGSSPLLALRTAGWFILGFPFILGFSYLFAWFAASMYRRFGLPALAAIWLALLTCLFLSIAGSLPQARLAGIVGSELADRVQIYRLIASDTFNDGTVTLGECSGTPELLAEIAERQSLNEQEIIPAALFARLTDGKDDDRTQLAYGDSRCVFFLSPKTGRILFRQQSVEPSER